MIMFKNTIDVRPIAYVTCTAETLDAIESAVGATLSGEYTSLVSMDNIREHVENYPDSELTKGLLTIPFPEGFDGDIVFQL